MDKPDYFTARLALAHHTTLARQRNATTFLWSFKKLICCFNHETFGPISVDTLLTFIKRCTAPVAPDDYPGYRLAMAHVILEPYNSYGSNSEIIRCRPNLPPSDPAVDGDKNVTGGNYIVFFEDPSGARDVYQPSQTLEDWEPDYKDLFEPFETIVNISDELKAKAARMLPHNGSFRRCVVTGQQSAGGPEDPGSTVQAHWIYPPSLVRWHVGPKINSKELAFWEAWESDSGTFKGPSNLIAMREDIYDLLHKNAFGIDIDASPRARIYIFDPSQVAQVESVSLPRHPVMEVKDPMARAFLREHFQHCLFSGIIGGDVMDDFNSNHNRVQLMLQYHYKMRTGEPVPDRAKIWWETEVGDALKEWMLYYESLDEVEEEE